MRSAGWLLLILLGFGSRPKGKWSDIKTKKKPTKQARSVPQSDMDILLPSGQVSQFEKVSDYLVGIIVVAYFSTMFGQLINVC